ncbi:MAG: UBP-type zinc finger domain-containing protein [Thaumarchaeota archaeon]|nr:UBP-type zinc finger domain-containing protein [Nitrososphaerota archaeon]
MKWFSSKPKQECEHFQQAKDKVSPKTVGCEECEKEGTDWVQLRMCLGCGHVGCCDSSVGMHATRHFKETGHPVMVALPKYSWKWCYVHKSYY